MGIWVWRMEYWTSLQSCCLSGTVWQLFIARFFVLPFCFHVRLIFRWLLFSRFYSCSVVALLLEALGLQAKYSVRNRNLYSDSSHYCHDKIDNLADGHRVGSMRRLNHHGMDKMKAISRFFWLSLAYSMLLLANQDTTYEYQSVKKPQQFCSGTSLTLQSRT